MQVTSHHISHFQDQQDLYQFLLACKQISTHEKAGPPLISISLKIDPVDPLAVLQTIGHPEQPYFYFEKVSQKEAIVAIDMALSFETVGSDRFRKVKQFIHTSLANTIKTGSLNSPFSGPTFFCGFTFFDRLLSEQTAFAPATVFAPRWQIARHGNTGVVVANFLLTPDLNLETTAHQLWQNFQAIRAIRYKVLNLPLPGYDCFQRQDVASTEQFKASVTQALHLIHQRNFDKVVLAHAIDVTAPIPFNLIYSLNHLRQLYPDCYVFAIGNGRGDNFLGASPERLLRISNQQLETDALAGSSPRGKTATEDAQLANRLLSSEKEAHEHRVVLDFILRRLTRLGLTPHLAPARLLQLSNIQHLQTPVQARVPNDIHLLDILAELHPTPAVAGAPQAVACQYLRRYEGFERGLYAAPLGWVDHQGNGEFAVGIRSALINQHSARLYAGAGIVAGSDPERELAEVQLKLQALLAALV